MLTNPNPAYGENVCLMQETKTGDNYTKAVNNMVEAYNLEGKILNGKKETGLKLTTVWEKSRFE